MLSRQRNFVPERASSRIEIYGLSNASCVEQEPVWVFARFFQLFCARLLALKIRAPTSLAKNEIVFRS